MGGDRPLWPVLGRCFLGDFLYTDGMKNKRSRKRMQGKLGREVKVGHKVGHRVIVSFRGSAAQAVFNHLVERFRASGYGATEQP